MAARKPDGGRQRALDEVIDFRPALSGEITLFGHPAHHDTSVETRRSTKPHVETAVALKPICRRHSKMCFHKRAKASHAKKQRGKAECPVRSSGAAASEPTQHPKGGEALHKTCSSTSKRATCTLDHGDGRFGMPQKNEQLSTKSKVRNVCAAENPTMDAPTGSGESAHGEPAQHTRLEPVKARAEVCVPIG